MLGDRQGWMIEELMPRLGPRNQIGSSPVSRIWRTDLANVFREYREQAACLRRSKQRLQRTSVRVLADDIGRKSPRR